MGQNKLAQKEASSYIGLSAILSFEFKMHGQPASGIFSESCQIKKKKEFLVLQTAMIEQSPIHTHTHT